MEDVNRYRIVVLGSGAIAGLAGAYIGAAGYDVTLTDKWVEHVEAMRTRGLDTTGMRDNRHFDVKACLVSELKEPLDMLFIGTKTQNTVEAMTSVKHLLTPRTTIVSMQNGFNFETLQQFVPAAQIVGTVPNYGGALVNPGHLEFVHEGPHHIGELDGSTSERILWLQAAYRHLTDCHISDNIIGEIWGKQCYGSQIVLTALVDAPTHRVLDIPKYRRLGILAVQEGLAVARAAGIVIPPSVSFDPVLYSPRTPEDTRRLFDHLDELFERLSRHKDRDTRKFVKQGSGIWWDIVYRKRPSETRWLEGAVIEKAHRLGVPMPLNERLVEMIYQIERGERRLGWGNLEELDAYRASLRLELP